MQELAPSIILQDYLEKLPIHIQDDFQEIVSLMSLIAPDATLSLKSGMPLFEIDHEGLFGLAARPGYLSLYIPDSQLLSHFEERLLPAHMGSDCFHFENLEGTDKTISSLDMSKDTFLLSITDWLIFFGLKYSKSVPLGTEKISLLSILKFSIK